MWPQLCSGFLGGVLWMTLCRVGGRFAAVVGCALWVTAAHGQDSAPANQPRLPASASEARRNDGSPGPGGRGHPQSQGHQQEDGEEGTRATTGDGSGPTPAGRLHKPVRDGYDITQRFRRKAERSGNKDGHAEFSKRRSPFRSSRATSSIRATSRPSSRRCSTCPASIRIRAERIRASTSTRSAGSTRRQRRLRDGLKELGNADNFAHFRTETYGLERIDVIRGPSSVLYGQIAPGGLVNAITKRPTAEPYGRSKGKSAPMIFSRGRSTWVVR